MATVLIIDDDETTRALIGISVEELGHFPTYAHDGKEGGDLVTAQSYDVVFMDLAMPNKNGVMAIQEIMKEFPATKIIAISGGNPELLERAEEAGASLTMVKPLKPKEVQDGVERLLSKHRPSRGWDDASIL